MSNFKKVIMVLTLLIGISSAIVVGSFLFMYKTGEITINFSKSKEDKILKEEELEIFSWWTGGGEAQGLEALFEIFNQKNSDMEIINAAISGGGGSSAKAVLKTRMLGGNPPDSFQVHGGSELIDTYVRAGVMEPITNLINELGIKDKFKQEILEMCSYQGEVYAIPLAVHRGNILWYNKSLLKKYNLKPPTNFSSFLSSLEELSKQGITPLSLGDKDRWPATHIFESLLLSTLGPKAYNGLWNGNTSFSNPKVKEALVRFNEILRYTNQDHAALSWQDSARRLYEGKAVFNIMGDWEEGYFKALGWEADQEFGWSNFPGTKGSFMVIVDSFGLPKEAANPESTKSWLKVIASREGQDVFNQIKGSIPSRIDVDKNKYDLYMKEAIDDFSNNILTPSIAHGSAAPENFMVALDDVINEFVSERNIERSFNNIQDIADKYLK
ncbi:ABC transporter substrate-binding protein [Orenia marismortui]|uniref:Probable sugar-binding periplasmic protein n=1 Tax=Orenia marismortui TaxID=46469 RepID=A0A4R8GYD9_9FIRM|nr:ABC transporter substrate-binding protein [Orenia marismortui]TDX51526.1 carbohydrate ABC transporter substrate-binding protein (CUT1 family) [Orenia marismortui]